MSGPGPTNSLVDVAGLRVGHASRVGAGWLTGTTVVLAPPGGATAGVDVRGGGPGTRETDLLDPRNVVERVHAVVLSGGSAYGLASAEGVMLRLERDGVGLVVGAGPGEVVPIVPAAIIFDLGRGGDFRRRPVAELGEAAYDDAVSAQGAGPARQGCVGAGTGAVAGGLKGGVGSASLRLPSGITVAALAVVNAVGSAVDPRTGRLWALDAGVEGEFDELAPPGSERVGAGPAPGEARGLNTTIGVVATDAPLTKAQCRRLAEAGQDGLARAIRPAHTMFDGDTIFGLSTGSASEAADPATLNSLLAAAAACFERAIGHGLLAAATTTTPAGTWRSYSETHLRVGSAGT